MTDRLRPTRRSTRWLGALAAATLFVGASACETEPDASDQSAPRVETTPPSTFRVAPPTSTTTTTVPIDYLGSCVEHAKFQAFTGNEFWAAIWDEVERDEAGMRDACEFLGAEQPGLLEEIHASWIELQRLSGVSSTTTVAP